MTIENESTVTIEVNDSRLDLIFVRTKDGRSIPTEIDPATRLVAGIFVNASADVRLCDLVATLPPSAAASK